MERYADALRRAGIDTVAAFAAVSSPDDLPSDIPFAARMTLATQAHVGDLIVSIDEFTAPPQQQPAQPHGNTKVQQHGERQPAHD
eukprot:gene46200-23987_t